MPASYTNVSKSSAPTYTKVSKSLDYDYLLMEDGSYLLLEDNGKIILEQSGSSTAWTKVSRNSASYTNVAKS